MKPSASGSKLQTRTWSDKTTLEDYVCVDNDVSITEAVTPLFVKFKWVTMSITPHLTKRRMFHHPHHALKDFVTERTVCD